jgi:hypothetical protein
VAISHDDGLTWEPRYYQGPSGGTPPTPYRVRVLPNGSIAVVGWTGTTLYLYISDDDGSSWRIVHTATMSSGFPYLERDSANSALYLLRGTDDIDIIELSFGHEPDAVVGSNANGHYIRYSNGVQICWHNASVNHTTIRNNNIGTYGWSYYLDSATWTFPQAFVSTDGLTVVTGGAGAGPGIVGTVTTTSTTHALLAPSSGTGTKQHLLAIGYWK